MQAFRNNQYRSHECPTKLINLEWVVYPCTPIPSWGDKYLIVVIETLLGEERCPGKYVIEFTRPVSCTAHKASHRPSSLALSPPHSCCPPDSSHTGLLPVFLCRPSLFLFRGLECGFLKCSLDRVLVTQVSAHVSPFWRISLVTRFNIASTTAREFYII